MKGEYLVPNKINKQKEIFLKKRLAETKFIVPWVQYDDTIDVNNNIIQKKKSVGKSSSKILIKKGIVMLHEYKSNGEKV